MAKRGNRQNKTILGMSDAALQKASESSIKLDTTDGFVQKFKLKSGKIVPFTWREIPAEKVESDTFVDFTVNGRDPNSVTPESVLDIRKTIVHNQFSPVIGFNTDNGLNILDGQRRRMAAICENCCLKGLFAEEEISISDAKQLARDIQVAKEHNLRDLGFTVKEYKAAGLQGKEIAEVMAISPSKVSRADKAASIDAEFLKPIPDVNDLIISDYTLLANISELLSTLDIEHTSFISGALDDLNIDEDAKTDVIKDAVIDLYSESFNQLKKSKKPKKAGPVKLPIFDFDAKSKKKAIRVDNDRVTKFEFTRLTKAQLDAIENSIKSILAEDSE